MSFNIVKSGDKYLIFKSYKEGDKEFSRVVKKVNDLKVAKKYVKEDAVPANCVGGGAIAGLDIGIVQKYKKLKKKKWSNHY